MNHLRNARAQCGEEEQTSKRVRLQKSKVETCSSFSTIQIGLSIRSSFHKTVNRDYYLETL